MTTVAKLAQESPGLSAQGPNFVPLLDQNGIVGYGVYSECGIVIFAPVPSAPVINTKRTTLLNPLPPVNRYKCLMQPTLHGVLLRAFGIQLQLGGGKSEVGLVPTSNSGGWLLGDLDKLGRPSERVKLPSHVGIEDNKQVGPLANAGRLDSPVFPLRQQQRGEPLPKRK